jgi:hypothetical protein
MPKEVRRCIVIDGKPACELDYKAHEELELLVERRTVELAKANGGLPMTWLQLDMSIDRFRSPLIFELNAKLRYRGSRLPLPSGQQ